MAEIQIMIDIIASRPGGDNIIRGVEQKIFPSGREAEKWYRANKERLIEKYDLDPSKCSIRYKFVPIKAPKKMSP